MLAALWPSLTALHGVNIKKSPLTGRVTQRYTTQKKKEFLVRGLCIRRGFYEKNGIRKRLQDRRPDMEENTQGWDYAFLAKSAFGYSGWPTSLPHIQTRSFRSAGQLLRGESIILTQIPQRDMRPNLEPSFKGYIGSERTTILHAAWPSEHLIRSG